MQVWFLEGYIDSPTRMRKLPIERFPFVIGRHTGLALSLHSVNVSRYHAEICKENGQLFLKDLKSTNGTFINHKPVAGKTAIKQGDILHIADIALRLTFETVPPTFANTSTTLGIAGAASKLPVGILEIEEMLTLKSVTSVFQPIYSRDAGDVVAFEILGRGAHEKLPKSPGALFKLAERCDAEIALVELLRQDGVQRANASRLHLPFFINIHPRELDAPDRLLNSVRAVCEQFPAIQLVLEIHEKAVTDLNVMKIMRSALNQLGIKLAYDDFGAGQTRLLELAEAPPDYLKFDIRLIKDIDGAQARKEMLALLLQLSKKFNIQTLAEGISNEREARVCRALGFDFFQGFYYGRPAPLPHR